jgi:hypothetical protein
LESLSHNVEYVAKKSGLKSQKDIFHIKKAAKEDRIIAALDRDFYADKNLPRYFECPAVLPQGDHGCLPFAAGSNAPRLNEVTGFTCSGLERQWDLVNFNLKPEF